MPKTPKSQIFVLQPFGKETDAAYALICEATAKAGVTVARADTISLKGNIVGTIFSVIQQAALIIADVSHGNPNVMYELGFAQALNKPIILVAAGIRTVPFDLAGLRVLIYDLKDPSDFIHRLRNAIDQAISRPEPFVLSNIFGQTKAQSVFISYSHKDAVFLDRLITHLKPLERDGLISLWADTRLRAGDIWKKEIESALQNATVAVLLISADFLASDFITQNELPPLLRKAEDRGTRIIPLLVKPSRFTRDKSLRHFQAVNTPEHALILLPEGERELYYDKVAAEIEKTLHRINPHEN